MSSRQDSTSSRSFSDSEWRASYAALFAKEKSSLQRDAWLRNGAVLPMTRVEKDYSSKGPA